MRYVLLIPGWFPSKVNFLAGDFIERHARAASVHFPVKVLFVVKKDDLPFGKISLERTLYSANYETFVYYYSSGAAKGGLGKIASALLQAKCFAKGFKKIVSANGLPSLIHAHVLVKHAWFALKKSKQHNIPLLASEQWTGYLPEAKGEFDSLTKFQQQTIGKVLKHAVYVTTVSEYLAQQIRKRFYFNSHTVIPNLVDTSLFQPLKKETSDLTRFIHISTLSTQKNIDELLEACAILKQTTDSFLLEIVSPPNAFYEQKVNEMGLSPNIIFKNEVPQALLSKMVAASDALLLYSNYETFGCVIVEANACGVPVIVSDFPVFDENVKEGITGLKAPLHQPKALAGCMMKFINKQTDFNAEQIISITKNNYSSEVVGKQFAAVYDQYAKP